MTINATGSPRSSHGEETGAPKLVASSRKREAVRPRVPGRPGRRTDAMYDRHEIRVERDGRPESLPSIYVSQGELSPMLKPLTLSLSLAVALGLCSVSKAGLHDGGCTTCGLASPQGVVASPQSTSVRLRRGRLASPKHQWGSGLKKLCGLFHHSVSYEWVLKKKHNFSFGHGSSGCSTCGTAAPVYPTGQHVAPTSQDRRLGPVLRPRRSTAPASTPSCRPAPRPASPRFRPR